MVLPLQIFGGLRVVSAQHQQPGGVGEEWSTPLGPKGGSKKGCRLCHLLRRGWGSDLSLSVQFSLLPMAQDGLSSSGSQGEAVCRQLGLSLELC